MENNKQEESESSKRKISKKVIYIGSILGLAVVFFSIKMGYHAWCNETTDDAQVDGNIIPVRTMVTGYVDQIRFSDNERVKKGDTLVIYDTTQLKAQVADARAKVLAAQAELQSCRTSVSASEYTVLMSVANSGSAMDNISAAEAHARQALSHIESARAQLTLAEDQYHHAFVLAPCDGIVSKKSVEAGQFVPSGMALASMISLSDIWVTANYKETQLENLRPGQQAVITLDAYPGLRIKGKVESLCGATGAKFSILPAENATGNFIKVTQRIPVRIKLEKWNDSRELLPGMNVVVSVKTK